MAMFPNEQGKYALQIEILLVVDVGRFCTHVVGCETANLTEKKRMEVW